MSIFQRITLNAAVATALMLVAAVCAHAEQPFPSKPIRIIVPFTAGGGTAIMARLLGMKMGDTWGQPVVIENRTGASGTIRAPVA